MTRPVEQLKTYSTIYHDFTEAYVTVDQLTRDFYPLAKSFVESTEPEINQQLKKLSAGGNNIVNPKSYQMVLDYMSHFDDFALNANKLFSDIKTALEQSEAFMTKVLDMKQKAGSNSNPVEEYTGLIPELTEIIGDLKLSLSRAAEMEKRMKGLQHDWGNTKSKMR